MNNPLNEFTPEQLVDELRRRGMTVAAFAEGTIAARTQPRLIETALRTLAEIRHHNDLADFEREHLSGLQVTVADEVLQMWQNDDVDEADDDGGPGPDVPTPPADEVHSDYIDRFLSEGDPLHSGGTVGYRQVGVRLVGDLELVGLPEQLANFGQAFVDRFRPAQFALAVGSIDRGYGLYGPCAPEEDGPELKILGVIDERDNYDFIELRTLVSRRAR